MIKTVTITNYLGKKVQIDLFDGEPEHGMIIKSITGLGPPKANINMTDLSTIDGAVFNSARSEKRNIVIDMMFTYAPTIEDSRQRTYKYFPIKKPINIMIETDNRTLETNGYVESNEPDIFSKDETNRISIICEDSYFYLYEDDNIVNGSNVEPFFEFPFSNESLSEPLIKFGTIHMFAPAIVDYKGTVETGVIIKIIISGDMEEYDTLEIRNYTTNEKMELYIHDIIEIISDDIGNDDVIIITTIQGKKSIKLYHNGQYINILNALDIDSDWIKLVNGENIFSVMFDDSNDADIKFSVEYKNVYEGV